MGAALSGLMMARREVKHRSAKAPIGSVIGDSSAPRLCVSYCGASNPVASRDRRFSDLPTSRKVPDMERSPEGERLDRHGWLPRVELTRLLPSQMKRLGTSWVRWYRSTTDSFGSFPIRAVPSRWT